jgi:type I restriction enzyme M protein
MKRSDLDDFVEAYKPGQPLSVREESERFKRWTYEEIAERDGFNLDIWADVRDESLTDGASLPAPEVIAEEIVEHLSAALEQFEVVAAELGGNGAVDAETGATQIVE